MPPGSTKWQLVHELSHRVLSVTTMGREHIWRIDLKELDFDCKQPIRLFSINKPIKGNAKQHLGIYEQAGYDEFLDKLRNSLKAPAESFKLISGYPKTLRCAP
jgi:hypothetical protein